MSAPQIQYPPTSGGGTPTGGSGTANTIPLWTGSTPSTTLTDSLLSQASTIITNSGTFRTADGSNTEPGYTFTNSSGSGMYRRSSGSILAFSASGAFAFGISSSQRMYIGTAATAVPTERLEIGGGLRIAGAANVATATGSQPAVLSLEFPVTRLYTGDGTGYTFAVSKRNFSVTTDMLVVNDVNGYVGIGTASPNKKFQVLDGATGEVRFTTTANVVGNTITQRFSSNAGAGAYEGGGAYIQAIQGSGIDVWSLAFGTANLSATAQERARIDSAGRWYVGVSAVVAPASGGIWAIINQPGAAGGQEWHNSSASPGGAAIIPTQNRATWYVYQNAVGSEAYSQSCVFTPTGIDLTGASATHGLKLPATPGNPDTQTLDAYAEGTYTPTTTGFGGTVSSATGAYTRIGRMVFCEVLLNGTAMTASYGTSIVSAPFTIAAGCASTVQGQSPVGYGIGATSPSSTQLYVPTMASASTMRFTCTYFV